MLHHQLPHCVLVVFILIKQSRAQPITNTCNAEDTCESCVSFGNCCWIKTARGTRRCVKMNSHVGERIVDFVTFETRKGCHGMKVIDTSTTTEKNQNEPILVGVDNSTESDAIQLNTTNIGFAKLYLYKQKTEIALKFLNSLIPQLQLVQQNIDALYHGNAEYVNISTSIERYKVLDKAIDNELLAIETKFLNNRMIIKDYLDAYDIMEHKMEFMQGTLQRALAISN